MTVRTYRVRDRWYVDLYTGPGEMPHDRAGPFDDELDALECAERALSIAGWVPPRRRIQLRGGQSIAKQCVP